MLDIRRRYFAKRPTWSDDASIIHQRIQLAPFRIHRFEHADDISFNACLLRDLESLLRLQKSVRDGGVVDRELRDIAAVNLHMVSAAPELGGRGAAAKSDTRWSTIEDLRDLGYRTADAWLQEHHDELGHESSFAFEEEERGAA